MRASARSISGGTVTLIPPTQIIRQPIETHVVDGVEIIFQLAPETEAPAEMHMFYPGLKALNLAENATHNLHNIYPIRGAQVRDANAWAKYLNEARDRFATKSDVVFAQHHWPVWGNVAPARLHGQAARHLQIPARPDAAAHQPRPQVGGDRRAARAAARAWQREWHVRGYYGTFSHNAKAIYQRYLGWYDANPANLNPLPPVERAKKYVAYMGGAERCHRQGARGLRQGRVPLGGRCHEPGRVRRAGQHGGARARRRCHGADGLSGRVRHLAQRLPVRRPGAAARHDRRRPAPARAGRDIVRSLTLDLFFDFLGVRLNGDKAEGKTIVVNWAFPDTSERYALTLQNCALTYLADRHAEAADATVTLDRTVLNRVILRELALPEAMAQGLVKIEGNPMKVAELFGLFDDFTMAFEIVEPADEIAPSPRPYGERVGHLVAPP